MSQEPTAAHLATADRSPQLCVRSPARRQSPFWMTHNTKIQMSEKHV